MFQIPCNFLPKLSVKSGTGSANERSDGEPFVRFVNPWIRSFTERAFDNVKTDFEYSFVHHLTALDELDSKKEELLSRKATFLMKYEGKQHPVCILLEKCAESFIVLFGEDIGDFLAEILNKIFLKIIKQHQDRISGRNTDLVNICLEPLRKMEFLSKYQIKSITSKWNIARNLNSSVPLRLEIEKRIQKKKIKNFQNEIIKFLFDEKFNFKEVETYLELRDIYSQILFRSSRLPITFQIMSIEAKTNFLRAWLVRKQNPKPNDLMSDIYRSNQFHDLKNRKMVEIELFAREITKTLENSRDITWDQLDAEVQDYIRSGLTIKSGIIFYPLLKMYFFETNFAILILTHFDSY